jgi:hypothetical protein
MLLSKLSPHRRNHRNLASAFIGEIVAAMEVVADKPEVGRLQLALCAVRDSAFDFSDFQLLGLAVYKINVAKLSLCASLPKHRFDHAWIGAIL